MSLLGRLEDLSLADIVQIVFLSRRTGILEIVDRKGRHTVLFRQGLIVNASDPEHPDLVSYLFARGQLVGDKVSMVRQMEDSGIPAGTAILEMNLMAPADLTEALRERILKVVGALAESREGEFNFILSESMTNEDIEYDPDVLFKEGGFAPQKVLASGEGEKLKPLRGLEESLKVGKALLRGTIPVEAPRAIDLHPEEKATVLPFPAREEGPAAPPSPAFTPIEAPEIPEEGEEREEAKPRSAPPAGTGKFKVAGGLFEVESPEATFRNVVVLEQNPLVRVAAKRAFGKKGVKISQFGSIDDVRGAVADLFRSNAFFVTFLELSGGDSAVGLMQQIKRRNPRLPVVLIDAQADLRRRHDLLRAGADLYLTKPSQERLQPGLAEEELALFADELVLFAERAFEQWEQLTSGFGPEAGKKFYEMGGKEHLERSFGLLKQLINELSDPSDIGQVAATILRLSAQYLERGALFSVSDDQFVGLGAFAARGGEELDRRVRALRVPRPEASILREVEETKAPHRGKMRRTAANVKLIEELGGTLPTEVVALPIMHGGRAIGILYGDNAEHRAPIDSMTGLEIFLSQAGYAFGNAVFALQNAGRGRET